MSNLQSWPLNILTRPRASRTRCLRPSHPSPKPSRPSPFAIPYSLPKTSRPPHSHLFGNRRYGPRIRSDPWWSSGIHHVVRRTICYPIVGGDCILGDFNVGCGTLHCWVGFGGDRTNKIDFTGYRRSGEDCEHPSHF